jgi:hypothetical protein
MKMLINPQRHRRQNLELLQRLNTRRHRHQLQQDSPLNTQQAD